MIHMIQTMIASYSSIGLEISGIWLPDELFEQLRLELMAGVLVGADSHSELTTQFKSPGKVAEIMGVKIYQSTDRKEMKVVSGRINI